MKTQDLMKLVVQGNQPLVRLTGELWDESFGQAGMIARVKSALEKHDNTVSVLFDYEEHRAHNVALDKPNWFLGDGDKMGTALEAGMFKDGLDEVVYFEEGQELPFELAEEETPLTEYLESGSEVPYVQWLEAKLEELVPNCMKTWKKDID